MLRSVLGRWPQLLPLTFAFVRPVSLLLGTLIRLSQVLLLNPFSRVGDEGKEAHRLLFNCKSHRTRVEIGGLGLSFNEGFIILLFSAASAFVSSALAGAQ